MLEKLPLEIDTRMMRVIYHILTECSVSRAAVLLDMSQPAASQSLKRWRDVTGDALLVRSGSHMVLTDHGQQVLRKVTLVLAELDTIIHAPDHFDASISRRKATLFTANSLAPYFVPRLVEIVRQEAPLMQMDLRPIMSEVQLVHELESGEIDLAVGNWPTPPVNMRYARLFQSEIVCVVRSGHALATVADIDLKTYLTLDHLSPTPSTSLTISPISSRLAELGLRRRIAVSIPEFSLVPQVIASTDLVFTTARALAEKMAHQHGFVLLGAPKELGAMTFYMLWHDRLHHSAYGKWLRSLVKRVSDDISSAPSAEKREGLAKGT
jgi:DNA-binding transcriptional LysR family regulator